MCFIEEKREGRSKDLCCRKYVVFGLLKIYARMCQKRACNRCRYRYKDTDTKIQMQKATATNEKPTQETLMTPRKSKRAAAKKKIKYKKKEK